MFVLGHNFELLFEVINAMLKSDAVDGESCLAVVNKLSMQGAGAATSCLTPITGLRDPPQVLMVVY